MSIEEELLDSAPARTATEILELLGPLVDEQKSLIAAEAESREFFAKQREPYDNAIRDLRQELRLLLMETNAAAEFGGGLKAVLRRKVVFSIVDEAELRRHLVATNRLEQFLVLDPKRLAVVGKKGQLPGTTLVDQRELVLTEAPE